MVKRSWSRVLVGLATIAVAALAMAIGPGGAAQASPYTPPADGQFHQIYRKDNGECLKTRSWLHAEQIVTRSCDGTPYVGWKFTSVGGGYYQVTNAYNDYCLDVAYLSGDDGAQVVQANCWGGANQQWRFNLTPDGYFEIIARHSQKCLDISQGWAIQWSCHSVGWERFQVR